MNGYNYGLRGIFKGSKFGIKKTFKNKTLSLFWNKKTKQFNDNTILWIIILLETHTMGTTNIT